jgi:hypothetical protein
VADLSIRFEEPKVGGLTGAQHYQLRLWGGENRCDFEDELNNRCPDEPANGSRFCSFHSQDHDPEYAAHEPTYDEYDCYVDRNYE